MHLFLGLFLFFSPRFSVDIFFHILSPLAIGVRILRFLSSFPDFRAGGERGGGEVKDCSRLKHSNQSTCQGTPGLGNYIGLTLRSWEFK